jgi:hypothetical protein
MQRHFASLKVFILGCIAAYSSTSGAGFNVDGGSGGSGGTGGGGGAGGNGSGGEGGGGGVVHLGGGGDGGGDSGSGTCVVTDPNTDMDKDGWTPNQGDCNDCDPFINPGAYDIPGSGIDEDCSGVVDDEPTGCDSMVTLLSTNPGDAAKAIDLCKFTTAGATGKARTWGVVNAEYVMPDGTTTATASADFPPGFGLLSGFGVNPPEQGVAMLGLSSGTARQPTDSGWIDPGKPYGGEHRRAGHDFALRDLGLDRRQSRLHGSHRQLQVGLHAADLDDTRDRSGAEVAEWKLYNGTGGLRRLRTHEARFMRAQLSRFSYSPSQRARDRTQALMGAHRRRGPMQRRFAILNVFVLACIAACSSASGTGFNVDGGAGGSGGTGGSGGAGGTGGGGGGGSGGSGIHLGGNDGGTGGDASKGSCVVTDPNVDMDKDGWTPNQGDCNDCDPDVNPGAIDVWHPATGSMPGYWGDEDCSGVAGDNAMPCDTGLALDDVTPMDGAKAIELCAQATTSNRKYGVISATYERADGTTYSPGLQAGIEPGFGTNVHVQAGANMLVLSVGHARTIGQTGACNGISCVTNATGTPPTGFPEDDPACPPTKAIADDVALELQIRTPTNATGYAFNFKFYSFEYPNYVCDTEGYNDQFIALVTPPPKGAYVPSGSMGGNISFDSSGNPVSVNMGYFDVCDPTTPSRFASSCKAGGGTCPPLPSPYCPLGTSELSGTGFDVWSTDGPAGGTRWLQTEAPATPGSIITIRFAIWDAGNPYYDSTVLIDNFHWLATGGSVATTPVPAPK